MNIICPKCGNQLNENSILCPGCGTSIKKQAQPYNFINPASSRKIEGSAPVQPQQNYNNAPIQPQQNYNNAPAQPQQNYNNALVQPQQNYNNAPVQPQQNYNNMPVQPQQTQPVLQQSLPVNPLLGKNAEKYKPAPKAPKSKKKHKLPWILRFIIANIIIVLFLFGVWYAFGNLITLGSHSNKVVETLNSGSLELPGMNNAYNELPNYIKDMLGEEYKNKNEYGPMTKAILPYISAEKVKVNGFFGSSSVEYRITAPDIESWLLELDPASVTSADALLTMMEEYIKTAPKRSANVTIEYTRNGFFSTDWYGNYYTREFSDAVCGGFNSAYNELYSKVYDEIMGTIYGAQEEKK